MAVQPKPDDDATAAMGLPRHLDQDAAQLRLIPQDIIRPFEAEPRNAESVQGTQHADAHRQT